MTSIPPVPPSSLDPEVQEVVDEFCELMRRDEPPVFFGYLAHNPRMMRLVWDQIRALMDPKAPDHKQKHLIALGVCAAAGSSYFADSQANALRREGTSDEEIAEVLAVATLWSGLSTFANGVGLTGVRSWPDRK